MAAKAAGIEGEYVVWRIMGMKEGIRKPSDKVSVPWNPLTDDGDALRLAVKLCLSISTGPCVVQCNSISGALQGNFIKEDSIYQDHYAATRRAIVRAAAEIGKATGEQA
jgi:hypothetical protein